MNNALPACGIFYIVRQNSPKLEYKAHYYVKLEEEGLGGQNVSDNGKATEIFEGVKH